MSTLARYLEAQRRKQDSVPWLGRLWRAALAHTQDRCPWCLRISSELQLDHIIPKQWFEDELEANQPWNYQPLCGKCNRKKGKAMVVSLIPCSEGGIG